MIPHYRLRFDGLYRRLNNRNPTGHNAGFLSYGYLITTNGTVIATGHGVFLRGMHATSNIAEYLGQHGARTPVPSLSETSRDLFQLVSYR